MVGITIGIGPWKSTAQRAAKRMAEMTGLTCIVVDDQLARHLPTVAHPSWLKCHLLKISEGISTVMAFDADIICLRPWDPAATFESLGRPFMAVRDDNSRLVWNECRAHGLPFPDFYVNGGLTIFGPEHQPVWDAAWSRHPRYGTWLEQTALNKALLDLKVVTHPLPRRFNLLNHAAKIAPGDPVLDDAVNLHCCSSLIPERVHSCWEKYLPSVDSSHSERVTQ